MDQKPKEKLDVPNEVAASPVSAQSSGFDALVTSDQPVRPQSASTDVSSPSVVSPTPNPVVMPSPSVGQKPAENLAGGQSLAPRPAHSRFSFLKKRKVAVTGSLLAAVALLGGGASAYYFGYYANPTTVWKQALENTGKGYDELIKYTNAESKKQYNGVKQTGNFKLDTPDATFDGSINFASDNMSTTGSLDVGLGVTRVKLEERSIKPATSENHDIYFRASGIKGLQDVVGPEYGAVLDSLNNQWIVIDHSLLDNAQKQLGARGEKATKPLKPEHILSAFNETSTVQQDYLFAVDENKAVLKVVESLGKEKIDNREAYHYKVALRKNNMEAYLRALRDGVQKSELGTWIKDTTGRPVSDRISDADITRAIAGIKESDTFDVWMAADTRVLYKVRFSDKKNAAQNYVDIGLNYNGGNEYPFFVKGLSNTEGQSFSFNMTATLKQKTNNLDVKLDGKFDDGSFSSNFMIEPSNKKLGVVAPADAKQLSEIMSELGLGDYYNMITTQNPDNLLMPNEQPRLE